MSSLILRQNRSTARVLRPFVSNQVFTSRLIRKMSTKEAPKGLFEWLVVLPDQEGALERRLAVRPKHFANLKAADESGFMVMGGAILNKVPAEGEAMSFAGSALVVSASSKEEVLEKLKKDVYAENEVWDFEKAQIYPFKCAIRKAI